MDSDEKTGDKAKLTKKMDAHPFQKSTLDVLVKCWIGNEIQGPSTVGADRLAVTQYVAGELNPDSKTRRSTIAKLRKAGYIDGGGTTQPVVTSKAYDELVPVAPDLLGRIKAALVLAPRTVPHQEPDPEVIERELEQNWATTMVDLSLAEQKYVVQHSEDYLFFLADVQSPHDEKRAVLTTLKAPENDVLGRLRVVDGSFRARRAEWRAELRYQRLRGESLAHGAVELGGVSKEDAADFFASYTARTGHPLMAGPQQWSKDPSRWQEEHAAHLMAAQARKIHVMHEIAVLEAFERRLLDAIDLDPDATEITDQNRAAAWAKFLAGCDARIQKDIEDQDVAEAEKGRQP